MGGRVGGKAESRKWKAESQWSVGPGFWAARLFKLDPCLSALVRGLSSFPEFLISKFNQSVKPSSESLG
jgi:hypothetical protein